MATAKAGESITAKAAARMRRDYPFMREKLMTRESRTIQPKSQAEGGQWVCVDCGEALQNNIMAQVHTKRHRLAWWTGEYFEEP